MKITNKETMRLMVDLLNKYNDAYDKGQPLISDKEYDNLYFELQDAEKELNFAFDDSPTQKVRYVIKTSLEKVPHNHPMLSLDKTKDWNEFLNYFQNKDVVGMVKLDGLTCSLEYINGNLVGAETRGDGIMGEDILHNAKVIPSIPKKISYRDHLVVDGEIICTDSDFADFSNEYANSRNFASGSIRLLDSKECEKRKLTFVVWNIIYGYEDKNSFLDKLHLVKQLGFKVVPHTSSFDWDAKEFLVDKAKKLGYPIDGLVGRFDDIKYGESLGTTGHHSKSAFAFKFYDEEYETTLKDIEWSYGRTGILTPVAIFDPVDTGDSIIERASLHNLTIMQNLGIFGKGQKIKVCKMNEIIPQVTYADKTIGYQENGVWKLIQPLDIPTVCPCCGEPLSIKTSDQTSVLVCENKSCPDKLLNRVVHFCSKSGFDIKGLSEATLSKLIEWGWINNITDLFNLKDKRDEWIKKPGFGKASVDKILVNIDNACKNAEPWRIISAFGIPMVGVGTAKDLIKYYKTVENFYNAVINKSNFCSVPNIGEKIAENLSKFNYNEFEYLFKNGFISEKQISQQGKLNDLTFVITGHLNSYTNREELEHLIEELGGHVAKSVSAKTSYLINNDINSTSAKNRTAKSLNVPIITEFQFKELIEGE